MVSSQSRFRENKMSNTLNPLLMQAEFAYVAWERVWNEEMSLAKKAKLIRGMMKPLTDSRIIENTITSFSHLTFSELPFNFQFEILNYYLKRTNQSVIELKLKKFR